MDAEIENSMKLREFSTTPNPNPGLDVIIMDFSMMYKCT
jgi:hypothetical protein